MDEPAGIVFLRGLDAIVGQGHYNKTEIVARRDGAQTRRRGHAALPMEQFNSVFSLLSQIGAGAIITDREHVSCALAFCGGGCARFVELC
jgi:hypothetical protein